MKRYNAFKVFTQQQACPNPSASVFCIRYWNLYHYVAYSLSYLILKTFKNNESFYLILEDIGL